MREICISETTKIYIFEKALSEDICYQWIRRIETMNESRGPNLEFAKEIFETVQKNIGEFPIQVTGYRPEVTIGKKYTSIAAHYDPCLGNETWKVLCYLNDVSKGGTDFFDGSSWIEVNASAGTVVLFDISLFHRGQQGQEEKQKFTVGIRLETEVPIAE
jgi:hypothetical protein